MMSKNNGKVLKHSKMDRIPAISLFSGAMGLDSGLEGAGFLTALCVENDPEAVSDN